MPITEWRIWFAWYPVRLLTWEWAWLRQVRWRPAISGREGDISPFGFSDRYLRQDNPFRIGEEEGFKGGTKVAIISPVATVAAPSSGLLQIGRKKYGGE